MTKAQRSAAAKKAVQTRRLRQQFIDTYGHESFEVVTHMVNGVFDSNRLSDMTGVPVTSCAAYIANYTRLNTYHKVNDGNLSFLATRR